MNLSQVQAITTLSIIREGYPTKEITEDQNVVVVFEAPQDIAKLANNK